MRVVVTGRDGQVARALQCLATADVEIVAIGRPELDLEEPATIAPALARARPDVVINAAAYTAVDAAEADEARALRINADGAGAVSAAAAELGAPVVQISTDYVFDGRLGRPYRESDAIAPQNAYGRSKAAGEAAVAAANPRHAILRTAWVYSAGGRNFLTTMLRLAAEREEVAVVADQRGAPTPASAVAEGALAVGLRLARDPAPGLVGVFHTTCRGEATWADFAEAIFAQSAARGGPHARVRRIATAEYPTPAARPADARLDTARIARAYGVALPDWRTPIGEVVASALAARADPEKERT
ncbi:dTDP-4-dehydrorhamnose reductase [Salinarimonas sp.]|uniref:dTDP-4-dehydrorhamnose reductase n=1 Tax=Salinarimonas sp. TaxID=2766526 RepID=UPI0032D9A1C4